MIARWVTTYFLGAMVVYLFVSASSNDFSTSQRFRIALCWPLSVLSLMLWALRELYREYRFMRDYDKERK